MKKRVCAFILFGCFCLAAITAGENAAFASEGTLSPEESLSSEGTLSPEKNLSPEETLPMKENSFLKENSAPQESAKPVMTLEEYPRIDGSLACVPLCERLAAELTGCTQFEAEETMADFTNTNPSYQALAENKADIILAYEPADSTRESVKDFDALDMRPVGKDALVFITNAGNPVENLTLEEAAGIFTGEITSWSQVGGEDVPIKAFQRPESSGSQTLMRKLLIGDREMAENMEEVSSMDGIIEALKLYDNMSDSIGYSVYYYASQMYEQPDLKFLSIEGTAPSNDTIRSGEYPLVNEFYCVTGSASSEKAREIQDWLVSEEGQKFVEDCGYVPIN